MKRRNTDTLERAGRFLWFFKLTPAGRILVLTGVAVGALATPSLDIPAFHVFLSLFWLGLLAFVINLCMRPRVTVKGAFPEKATALLPVRGTFEVHNRGWLPVFGLGLGYFVLDRGLRLVHGNQVAAWVSSGESASIPVTIEPLRRGLYPLPKLRAYSTFPLGICRSGAAVGGRGKLLVLPRFAPIESIDVPIGTRYQPGGIALTSDIGESPEYIGNREYRPGDPARRIDFRAWGRLARPVVREYQEEYYCRVALILDTYVARHAWLKPRDGFPELEAAVSLAAGVADALSRGEYIIDIFAAGPELYVFRAGRHTAHFENVLEILACVEECRSNPFGKVTPALAGELASISTVICVLLDWDASREALMREAVEAGCSTKVLIVRDGKTAVPYAGAEDWVGPITHVTPRHVSSGSLGQL